MTAGGKNIAPQPIENALKTNKFIAEIVMIGNKRNFPAALVVPNPLPYASPKPDRWPSSVTGPADPGATLTRLLHTPPPAVAPGVLVEKDCCTDQVSSTPGAGWSIVHPVGGVSTVVVKLNDPPVGTVGAPACWRYTLAKKTDVPGVPGVPGLPLRLRLMV